MGELIKSTRRIAAPNLPIRKFVHQYQYDSWNRLLTIIYPDNETVSYFYDLGGNLMKMTGQNNSSPYDYIKQITYDLYEQRTAVKYGNNTVNTYQYDSLLRRLENMTAKQFNNTMMLDNDYTYDYVGNITQLINTALPVANKMGGNYTFNYQYDKLNRLASANGSFRGYSGSGTPTFGDLSANFSLNMQYDNLHNITQKTQSHNKNNAVQEANTYANVYNYSQSKPHQLTSIQNGAATESFVYDANGNLKEHNGEDDWLYFWDESNRLRSAVLNEGKMMHYIYDSGGERTLKAITEYHGIFENGTPTDGGATLGSYTTWPSPYITIAPNKVYTKHYFAGTQRVASKPAGLADIFEISLTSEFDDLIMKQLGDIQAVSDTVGLGELTLKDADPGTIAPAIYFFHPDQLGSSTMISDGSGYAYQMFLNLPFGESMAEQRRSGNLNNPYKFNGKELDEETDLYYYGARYYNPKISNWLSVDPLAEQTMQPYQYTYQNPVRYIDPTGMAADDPPTDFIDINTGKITHIDDGKDQVIALTGKWIEKAQQYFDSNKDDYNSFLGMIENSVLNLNMTSDEFMFFAETLYAESSGGFGESLGIVNVLENRASNEGTSVLSQLSADPPYGVYGVWKTSNGKNSGYKYAYQNETGFGIEQKKNNIHRAIAVGLSTNTDVTNGAYFWDGRDITTNSHYKSWGLKFSNPKHNLWGLKETSGSAQLITTQAIGETTFTKYLNQGKKWFISK